MGHVDPTGRSGGIVLSPAGPDSWRAIDTSYPLSDARCLLAYVETIGHRYLVLSLIPPLGGVTEVETLSAAEAVVRDLRDHASQSTGPSGVDQRRTT